jgi:glycosyltransferase involved in cell wall biosynthesis
MAIALHCVEVFEEGSTLMRVLLLSQFYPPVIGGEERHIVTLSKALARRGHEVSVVSLPHPDRQEVMLDDGVAVNSIKGTLQRCGGLFSEQERPHAAPFPDPELAFRIGKLVAEMRPDVVHGHNWMSRAFLPSKSRSKAGFVVTLHDYSLLCARKNFMHEGLPCTGPGLLKCIGCASDHYGPVVGGVTCVGNWVTSRFERRAVDRYIAVSKAVATETGLEKLGRPYDVIPTFIPDDVGDLTPSCDGRLDLLPEDGYLLFVGDLTRGKGVHVLLEAYRLLPDAPPLVLIGRSCADTPRSLPPNVYMFESWPHASIMHAWKRCLFGIAPSVWPEACGTIVMEGNAVGKAMIASASGGLRDLIVDGKTGILVPPADPEALAQAIQSLIGDSDRRETMAATGLRHVQRFMAKSIVPKIEGIYRDVSMRSRPVPQDSRELMSVADGR